MASGESISMAIESYRDLDVWRRRREIVKAAYWLTVTFPEEERFGLTAQIRRAATSVPANMSIDLGYLAQQEAEALVGETQILGKQILSLERNLNRKRVNSEQ